MKALCGFLMGVCLALGQTFPISAENVRVAYTDFVPMSFEKDGKAMGHDIDLMQALCDDLRVSCEFVKFNSLAESFEAVKSGKCDAVVGGMSVTKERESIFDFSIPYMDSGLKAMKIKTDEARYSFWKNIATFNYPRSFFATIKQRPELFELLFWFSIFIFVIANIIYFTDLGSDRISDNYFKGIFESIYFCVVTCSTVGYGDITCVRVISRIVVLILILCGIASFANVTAMLSSQYVVQRMEEFNHESDMKNSTVVIERGSTSEDIAKKIAEKIICVDRVKDGIRCLKDKSAKYMIYDAPYIDYMVANGPREENMAFATWDRVFCPQKYAIILPENSTFKEAFDIGIEKFFEDGTLEKFRLKWMK